MVRLLFLADVPDVPKGVAGTSGTSVFLLGRTSNESHLLALVLAFRCLVRLVRLVRLQKYVFRKHKNKHVFHLLAEYEQMYHHHELVQGTQAAVIPSPAPPYSPPQRTLYQKQLEVPKIPLSLFPAQPCGKPEDFGWS
jgi:hypothetical protein